jgi:hypothetical protein
MSVSTAETWVQQNKYYYCGDKHEVPPDYCIFGSRSRCMRKGYGACLYKDEPKEAPKLVKCPKGSIKSERTWTEYQKFIHDNFQAVQKKMKGKAPSAILTELAKQWRREIAKGSVKGSAKRSSKKAKAKTKISPTKRRVRKTPSKRSPRTPSQIIDEDDL